MGDLNAQVGSERIWREREIGPYGIGNINENGVGLFEILP
jgi:hypothetical protein